MKQGTSTRVFTRSDNKERVRVGQVVVGGDDYINELARVGSVTGVKEASEEDLQNKAHESAGNTKAAGGARQSSASQAAQAFKQTTANKSGGGGNKKR
jgi:hypothetical protein